MEEKGVKIVLDADKLKTGRQGTWLSLFCKKSRRQLLRGALRCNRGNDNLMAYGWATQTVRSTASFSSESSLLWTPNGEIKGKKKKVFNIDIPNKLTEIKLFIMFQSR